MNDEKKIDLKQENFDNAMIHLDLDDLHKITQLYVKLCKNEEGE